MTSPTPTRQINASWQSHSVSPTLPSSALRGEGLGFGIWLYQAMLAGDAQGMREVKKLSKQRDKAADHAQIKHTSRRVWASFPEVRHKPRGRPKYSSYTVIS